MLKKALIDVNTEDRVDELILSQYKNSPNLIKYIKCFTRPVQSIITTSAHVIESRCIQKASGYSLDKIGKTVGEFRVIRGGAASPYFGFKDNASALGLGVGQLLSYGEKESGDLVLGDPDFRSLIQARIMKNTSGGRIEDIIKYLDLLTLGTMGGQTLNTQITQGTLNLSIHFKNKVPIPAKLLLSLRASDILSSGIGFTMTDLDGKIEVANGF